MFGLSVLLFLLSFAALIWGLIKPGSFNILFKDRANRKKITWTFLGAMVLFLVILGIIAPKTPVSQSVANKKTAVPQLASDTTQQNFFQANHTAPSEPNLTPVVSSSNLPEYGIQTKTSGCVANQALPDQACTSGAVLTTDTTVICKSGYTQTVRDVPLSERQRVFAEYDIPYDLHSDYEVDHLISLELGGSNDISNLWPEAYNITDGSRTKDGFENYLHSQVCSGKLSIAEVQAEISSNWLKYYQALPATSAANPQNAPVSGFSAGPANDSSATQNPSNTGNIHPPGATGQCVDGSYSYAANHRGACSHHGGVAQWY